MKKNIFFLLLFSFLGIIPCFSSVVYNLTDFETKYSDTDIGYFSYRGTNYYKTSFNPDLFLGPLEIGLDFNGFFSENKPLPTNLFPIFSLRHAAFEYNNEKMTVGTRWQRLSKVQYDYGLLMDNYDSGSAGPAEFNTAKGGGEFYYTSNIINLRTFCTASGVQAYEGDFRISENLILGKPLILGALYIQDSDGVFDIDSQTIKLRNPQKGYSFNLYVPIMDDNALNFYSEYAVLLNHGNGISAGFGGSMFDEILFYRLEGRYLDTGFVPGYFNASYEATTFDFDKSAPKTKAYGGALYIGLSLFDDYLKTEAMYENYTNTDPVFSWGIGWQKLFDMVGMINYIRSFQDAGAGIINASISYENFPFMPIPTKVSAFIRRVYKNPYNLNDYDQTIGFSFKPDIGDIFKVPFLKY